jgi:hypothetical protein
MANIKWSAFPSGGAIEAGDILVGLRAGVNYQLNAPIFGSQNVVVSTATQTMAPNTIYIIDDASSLVTLALPATSAVFDRISIVGQSADGWLVSQAAGQQIQVSPLQTTLGVSGSLASTNQYDSISLICIVANTIWTSFGGGQTQGFTIV